jgi:hypothetical protein
VHIRLEVIGGFTGKAGKQVIQIELAKLAPEEAAELRRLIERLPDDIWGGSYLAPHPKSWDFRHILQVTEGDNSRTAVFHGGQGPAELTTIARRLIESSGR